MNAIVSQTTPAKTTAIEWEECPCPLCGSEEYAPLREAADPLGRLRFLVVECRRCGLCFTNPRPDEVSIEQFYPDYYHCHKVTESSHHVEIHGTRFAVRGKGRLLDFGCGSGDFLQRMSRIGWQAVGLDSSEAAVAQVRKRGLPAHVGTLPGSLWTGPSFEMITMLQSLEHVHHPMEVLQAACRLLTPGGELMVSVPNIDGFAAHWFGPHWFGLDLPRHLTHFTPVTLQRMLKRAGFDRVEVRQERKSGWIRHSAKAMPHGFAMNRLLATRLGSGLMSWWGLCTGHAECLVAVATKLSEPDA